MCSAVIRTSLVSRSTTTQLVPSRRPSSSTIAACQWPVLLPGGERGGGLGIALLGAVVSARGRYATPCAFLHGLVPALTIGAITVVIGAAAALLIPPRHRATVTALNPTVEAA